MKPQTIYSFVYMKNMQTKNFFFNLLNEQEISSSKYIKLFKMKKYFPKAVIKTSSQILVVLESE